MTYKMKIMLALDSIYAVETKKFYLIYRLGLLILRGKKKKILAWTRE